MSAQQGWDSVRGRIKGGEERLATALAGFSKFRHAYPWDGLEGDLRQRSDESIYLVGYGSLLNPSSAARTVADTPPEGHPPVVAFGGRRVYEYVMPESVLSRYGWQGAPDERAALNVRPSADIRDCFNGRLIPFAISDLEGLREREKAYDLEPVAILPWDGLEQEPRLGFALSCPATPFEGQVFVDTGLRPHKPYHELCLAGAQMVSAEFADLFLETTFRGDGSPLS